MELTCGLCGAPITGGYFRTGGLVYHFNGACQVSPEIDTQSANPRGWAKITQTKPLTEEDVRRIVRDEMADMWRSQTTGAKVNP